MKTAIDLSPLYRSMVGFDRLAGLMDAAMQGDDERAYPPYDIEKTGEDTYRIAVAVAGFKTDELAITAQPNLLIIAGASAQSADSGRNYLHRGIAARSFERRFELADHVVVKGAQHADGVLSVDLAREPPEALKPRRIEVRVRAEAPAQIADGRATTHAA